MNWDNLVIFDGNNLTFDFVNLDMNSIITSVQQNPYFHQYYEPQLFSSYDAIAILNVPKDRFDSLFKINIKYEDLDDNSLNSLKYAVDHFGWYNNLSENVLFN